MTTTYELPAGLRPWAESLAPLVPEVALGLLPLVHGVEDLFHRREAGTGDQGPLDGYDGLTTRGHPDRILVSEWALAEEEPLEFLRRAASRELLHLAPAFRREQPHGRVVVLVDTGPAALGAPRLVQLAALIVLHRRAVAHGAEFVVGLLGDEPDSWLEGTLEGQYRAWRSSRRREVATVAEVRARDAAIGDTDECWLLASAPLAEELSERRKVLSSAEATWGPEGALSLHVALDRDTLELALPQSAVSIRALRGKAFRTESPQLAGTAGALRLPRFNSAERRLLMRGERPDEIFATHVNPEAQQASKLKRYSFARPVIAAAPHNRRIVAVVADHDHVRVRVIGKQLWKLQDIAVPRSLVGLHDEPDLNDLPPVFLDAGGVVTRIGDQWWRLSPEGAAGMDYLAAGPGAQQDHAVYATRGPDAVWVRGARFDGTFSSGLVGGNGMHALTQDGRQWTVYKGKEAVANIAVDEGSPIALADMLDEPALLTVGGAGLVVRLVSASRTRTLTKASGGIGQPTLHPRDPMLAVRFSDRVEVRNLSGRLLLTVQDDKP